MPRPDTGKVRIAIRIPKEWLARADSAKERLGRPGLTVSRTDALRVAISIGLDALEGPILPPAAKGEFNRINVR